MFVFQIMCINIQRDTFIDMESYSIYSFIQNYFVLCMSMAGSFTFFAIWYSTTVFSLHSSCSLTFPDQIDFLPPCPRDGNVTTENQIEMLFKNNFISPDPQMFKA